MPKGFHTVQIREEAYNRLSYLADRSGMSRAKVIEGLLRIGSMDPKEISGERATELLAMSAEAGNVSARIAYARLMAAKEVERASTPPENPLAELDELAARRRKGGVG